MTDVGIENDRFLETSVTGRSEFLVRRSAFSVRCCGVGIGALVLSHEIVERCQEGARGGVGSNRS